MLDREEIRPGGAGATAGKLYRHFTPGPVEMPEHICAITGRQVPYFRNRWFSDIVLECERMLLDLAGAPEGSRALFLTCSGTGGLEAALASFAPRDGVTYVINSQGFGQRLVDICEALERPVKEFVLPLGEAFRSDHVESTDVAGAGLVAAQAHDTISGVLHDVRAISSLARRAGALFMVDAISSFLCDPLHMEDMGIDVFVVGSQKALALAPGVAILILSPRAVEAVTGEGYRPGSYYFDLRAALSNADRGQTPFTPAVGVILQLHARLRDLRAMGLENVIAHTAELAAYFRERLAGSGLPLRVFPDVPSNAITALECTDERIDAHALVELVAERYGLYLTPNGGELRNRVFRVSHMGMQNRKSLDNLMEVLTSGIEEMITEEQRP